MYNFLERGIMTIYELNTILSSEIKSKLITHFWECQCQDHDVNYMVNKLGVSQSNLSKHIGKLLKFEVLKYKQVGKERFYFINHKFKEEWKEVIEPQIKLRENKSFICICNSEHSSCKH